MALDFMYMKSDGSLQDGPQEAWATTVGVCESTGTPLAVTVDTKGASNTYMHEATVDWIDRTLRLRRITLHTDGEPAILSLVNFVKLRRKDDTILEQAPRYSSSSSGIVENMIKRIQGQCRARRSDLESRYRIVLGVDSITWPWLVRHAMWLMARYDVRASGRTSYQQLNDSM